MPGSRASLVVGLLAPVGIPLCPGPAGCFHTGSDHRSRMTILNRLVASGTTSQYRASVSVVFVSLAISLIWPAPRPDVISTVLPTKLSGLAAVPKMLAPTAVSVAEGSGCAAERAGQFAAA